LALENSDRVSGTATSVASFFVSGVDTLTDKLLENQLSKTTSKVQKDKIETLPGKAAVANAKIAYKTYRDIFSDKRFAAVKGKGAHVQRLLWGSSGTKNPKYSDIKYVDELFAPETVNTMPETTLMAFKDHGHAKFTIHDRLAEAERFFLELRSIGVELDQITGQLEKEGVKSFSDSFFTLLNEIAAKRDSLLPKAQAEQRRSP
jgi:transaldolase/glucose-6-phosphate isomerase